MKSKIIKVVFSIFVLAMVVLSSVFAVCAVDPAHPTVNLYLGDQHTEKVDGKNYIKIPVYISDNTADLFIINYRVISNDKLIPTLFEDGSFYEKSSTGFSDTIKLNSTYTTNPTVITKQGYTGVQILQDSSNGTKGISTKSGLLGTVWFEVSDTSAKYTFSVENLGCNNVYTDNAGKKQIGVYTVNIPKENSFTSTQQTPSVSSSVSSVDEKEDTESDTQNTQNTQSDTSSEKTQGSIFDLFKKPQKNDTEDKGTMGYLKYVFAFIGAVAVTALIVFAIVFLKKKTKGKD